MDIIHFKIFKSRKVDNKVIKIFKNFKNKDIPAMPLKANILITKYNIPEGKELGKKIKMIEELWVDNEFKISEKEIQKIVND